MTIPVACPSKLPPTSGSSQDRATAIAFAEKLSEVVLKEGLSDDLPQP